MGHQEEPPQENSPPYKLTTTWQWVTKTAVAVGVSSAVVLTPGPQQPVRPGSTRDQLPSRAELQVDQDLVGNGFAMPVTPKPAHRAQAAAGKKAEQLSPGESVAPASGYSATTPLPVAPSTQARDRNEGPASPDASP